jgi:hypothetical protein
MATWVEITASSASIDFNPRAQKLGHPTLLLLNIPKVAEAGSAHMLQHRGIVINECYFWC